MTAAVEHLVLDPSSPWWGEHRSRYRFAGPLVAGLDVLDVACGSGFGGPILLDAGARSVLAVDNSEHALAEARGHSRPGIEFLRADATDLPLPDATMGAITSFETIEHVAAHERFLAELRRVLMPNGVLVLSTPNALHTRPSGGRPRNPFHVQEFTPWELRALLGRFFADVQLLGQRPHPRFRPCPYWERPDVLPTDPAGRAHVFTWRVANRLPAGTRDWVWRALRGRAFHPGECDFVFDPNECYSGHVLLAVCRP